MLQPLDLELCGCVFRAIAGSRVISVAEKPVGSGLEMRNPDSDSLESRIFLGAAPDDRNDIISPPYTCLDH